MQNGCVMNDIKKKKTNVKKLKRILDEVVDDEVDQDEAQKMLFLILIVEIKNLLNDKHETKWIL
jgi:hypothetical protein